MSSRAEIKPAPRALDLAPLGDVVVARGVGRAPASSPAAVKRTPLWVEALVVIWLCWVDDAVSNLASLRLHAALAHALGVLHLERTLHLDPELALNRWLTAHHTLGLAVSDYYDNAHFVVTLGLLGWLWYKRPDLYRPLRNALVAINVLGLLVFWLYPVAPPRMLLGMGFEDVVAATHAFGSWHTGALASAANQLAAMPSLHMAWAVWCSLVLWRLSARPSLRALAIFYPCLRPRSPFSRPAITSSPTSSPASRRPRSRFCWCKRSGDGTTTAAFRCEWRMSQTCYEVADQVDFGAAAADGLRRPGRSPPRSARGLLRL